MFLTVDFDDEQIDDLVRDVLLQHVEMELTPQPVIEALHRLIAYYSIPGTYMDGKYDCIDE